MLCVPLLSCNQTRYADVQLLITRPSLLLFTDVNMAVHIADLEKNLQSELPCWRFRSLYLYLENVFCLGFCFLSLFSWLCSTKYISIYPFCILYYTRIFVFCVASAAVFLCIGMSGSRYVSTPVCLPYTYCLKRSSLKMIASISLSARA